VPGISLIVGTQRVNFCCLITNVCPEIAPSLQHLLYTTGTPESCLRRMNPEEQFKNFMQDLKTIVPNYDKYGDILSIDVRNIDHEWPFGRTWRGRWDMPQETPIQNLYNLGDAVKPFGIAAFLIALRMQ
jgi:phytoene desaturase